MASEVSLSASDKKKVKELKEELKLQLKEELLEEVREELRVAFFVQRAELADIIRHTLQIVCDELDEEDRPKIKTCLLKLNQIVPIETEEAVKCLAKWNAENEAFRVERALTCLNSELLEREKRSKSRWMSDIAKLTHYVYEIGIDEPKQHVVNKLLERFKDRIVIVFKKADETVEDLCCTVHGEELYRMAEYLLPDLSRKNSISTCMGDNVRIIFPRNDNTREYYRKPDEEIVIINYDFYKRSRTYLHRLRLAGFSGPKKGIVINLIQPDELKYLSNLEVYYDICLEPFPEM